MHDILSEEGTIEEALETLEIVKSESEKIIEKIKVEIEDNRKLLLGINAEGQKQEN